MVHNRDDCCGLLCLVAAGLPALSYLDMSLLHILANILVHSANSVSQAPPNQLVYQRLQCHIVRCCCLQEIAEVEQLTDDNIGLELNHANVEMTLDEIRYSTPVHACTFCDPSSSSEPSILQMQAVLQAPMTECYSTKQRLLATQADMTVTWRDRTQHDKLDG